MKRKSRCWLIIVVVCVLSVLMYTSCNIRQKDDEQLARKYCGMCHLFPDPSMLDKQTWNNSVLPQMAFRMGFKDDAILARIAPADLPVVLETIPSKPMITDEEWALIRNYYVKNAPNFLSFKVEEIKDSIKQFAVYPSSLQIPS